MRGKVSLSERRTPQHDLALLNKSCNREPCTPQLNIAYGRAYWICMPLLSCEVPGHVAMRRHPIHPGGGEERSAKSERGKRKADGAG